MTITHFYKEATGRIQVSIRDLPDTDPVRPTGFGFLIDADGEYSAATHYVDVTATPPVFVAFPEKPSALHRFNWSTYEWEFPLEVELAKLVGNAKGERDRRIYAGFTWDGSTFDSDQVAQTRILGLFVSSTSAPGNFPIGWRLADNSWRSLSVSDAGYVWAALQGHIAAHFAAFAAHESAINALTTVAAVQAYDITADWPA